MISFYSYILLHITVKYYSYILMLHNTVYTLQLQTLSEIVFGVVFWV